MLSIKWKSATILSIACIVLFVLWLPGAGYPVVSDTAIYALLGESLWQHGTYALFGVPYAKHLPLHAFVSYPFTAALGFHLGMKFASLVAGWFVLLGTYLVFRDAMARTIGLLAVVFLLLHHGFLLLTQLGSADLLFTALFLFSLWGFLRAQEDERWYLFAGVLAGLACLTRYNGLPLFPLYLGFVLFRRRDHLWSPWFWGGLVSGAVLLSLWFLRNALVFGNPLYTEYTGELTAQAPSLITQFLSNIVYYGNPLQNVLPVLLLFGIYGIVRGWRAHLFLVLAMLCVWILTAVWWVQALRFAFPGYPILLGFAAYGMIAAIRDVRRWPALTTLFLMILILGMHGFAICLYTYGACNARFDRVIGNIPGNLGLSSEGFYTWDLARDYIDAHAEEGAHVLVEGEINQVVWQQGVFREDLQIAGEQAGACPLYAITQQPREGDNVLFATVAAPRTSVTLQRCP
ncbi:MAG: glycosyltransferase family 39 protein [Candidatus Peregrinibacteria bacterium]|nr:glycosyltransferase family 39 protein [Candidatus Peregrinibacteria bacterium]